MIRRTTRAYLFLVRYIYQSLQFVSLDTAASELESRSKILTPPKLGDKGKPHCVRCSCEMPHPGLLKADAGQAYEIIDSQYITQTNGEIFEWARTRGRGETLHVNHTRKFEVSWGGSIYAKLRDRSVFTPANT